MDEPTNRTPLDESQVILAVERAGGSYRKGKSGSVLLVDLSNAEPDDQLLEQLSAFPKLRELNLANCAIGNESTEALLKLERLQTLDLRHTEVGDRLAEQLPSLKRLKLVDLSQTRVTTEVVRAIRKKMIGTRIVCLD